MELRAYLRVLRHQWVVIVVSIVVCVGIAAGLAFATTPTYESRAQLFVSAAGSANDPGATYQSSLFSQERVLSYAQMVSSPAVLDAVINELQLDETSRELAAKVDASVPTGTVLLNLTARDSSAEQAAAIARALAEQFTKFVLRLETPPGASSSRVTVALTEPAQTPTSASSPRKAEYLAIGLVLGLVLGIVAAFIREALSAEPVRPRE
jgi:polysaccharide biosynthesis transport protein